MIINRSAVDDFEALKIAQGMEAASCYVFSITCDRHNHKEFPYIVWGRYHETEVSVDEIDKSIADQLY